MKNRYNFAMIGTWSSAIIVFIYFCVVRSLVYNDLVQSMSKEKYQLLSLPILAICFLIAGVSWYFRNKYALEGDRKISKASVKIFFIAASMLIVVYLFQ